MNETGHDRECWSESGSESALWLADYQEVLDEPATRFLWHVFIERRARALDQRRLFRSCVCGPPFWFFFQVGGVWRDNLPLARHCRSSSILQSQTWQLSSVSLLFIFTLPYSPGPCLFHSDYLFLRVSFCSNGSRPSTDKSEFSSTGDEARKDPTRWSTRSIQVEKKSRLSQFRMTSR